MIEVPQDVYKQVSAERKSASEMYLIRATSSLFNPKPKQNGCLIARVTGTVRAAGQCTATAM